MGRVAIARVASAIVAILLTWFGFLGVCTAAATSTAQANYAYNSSCAVVASATDHFDRAPPSTSARSILHIAAVWDGGGSVRVTDNTTTPDPTAGFTSGGELPQRAQASRATGSPPLFVDEGVSVFHGSRLATIGVNTAKPWELVRTEALSGRASARKVNEIADSMRANGWQGDPIKVVEVNGQRIVVDGHHRLAAARQAGIDVLRVITTSLAAIIRVGS